MSDTAHRRIARLMHDVHQALELEPLPGLDHADLDVVLREHGPRAAMGVGEASGDDRVSRAVEAALRDLARQLQAQAPASPGDDPPPAGPQDDRPEGGSAG